MLVAPFFFPSARHSCHLACIPFRHITKVQGHWPALPIARAFKKKKVVPREDSVWWLDANHGVKEKKNKRTRLDGGACAMPYDCRRPNHLFTLQIGDTPDDQRVFFASSAHGRKVIA